MGITQIEHVCGVLIMACQATHGDNILDHIFLVADAPRIQLTTKEALQVAAALTTIRRPTKMPIGLTKRDDETWLDAALRRAKLHGLEIEVEDHYNKRIACGVPEDDAAFEAIMEWDLAEFLPEDDGPPSVLTIQRD